MSWKSIASAGLFIVPVAVTFTDKIACASQVIGISMQPSLNPDYHKGKTDWLLQNKFALRKLKRGDIVTFIAPYNPNETAVKRVIGMEYDFVRPKKNRKVLHFIRKGHVWVEGDNSEHSRDSNNYGPISMGLITAKATHVIWPPNRWQKLDTVEIESSRVVKSSYHS